MKQKTKKVTTCLVLTLFILSLIGVASAETTIVDDEYNFFTDLMHKLQDLGLFTAAGQERVCSIEPDYTYTTTAGETISNSQLLSNCPTPVALYNIYDTSWNFLAEYQSELTGTGLTTSSPRIIEVYCCPYEACTSDADCSVYPASDFGDTCNTIYGSCYGETPSHETPIMKCVSDNWIRHDTAYYGDSDWCLEGRSNWIDRDGVTHSCREPTYSSVVDNTWCGAICAEEGASCGYSLTALECCSGLDCQNFQCVVTGTCTTGETKCGIVGNVNIVGELLYECVDGTFISQGRVDGQCGYTTSVPLPDPGLQCSDLGTDMNTCYERTDCVWTRFSACKSLLDAGCTGMREQDCLQGNSCEWTGTSCQVINDDNNDGTVESRTLTWTEFYSMDDKKFANGNYFCSETNECPLKDETTVTCSKDEVFRERYYDYFRDNCDEALGWWDEMANNLINWIPGLAQVDVCALGGKQYWESNWEESGGTCLAESDSWYGKLWDGALKLMGGMGLPFQYVMIITIMLLITLIGIAVRMVTR